jgi:peptidoglycan/xylan/chitin deacetylase (PgdA/CDA1 family)
MLLPLKRNCKLTKYFLVGFFDSFHISQMMFHIQVKLFSPFIRAVNYHDIPPSEADQFEKQLQYYQKHFSPVCYEDLILFHDNNIWEKKKPGLILSFDDGFRSSYEVVAPLLEKYEFTGWFFIPAGVVDVPIEDQPKEALKFKITPKPYPYGDKRVFLTWDQIMELDKNHVIGSHTLTHSRLRFNLSEEQLYQEIVVSKQVMKSNLGHEIQIFAWVGGEEGSYSYEAANIIQQAEYKVVFLTNNSLIRSHTNLHLLDRTNIESNFSIGLMEFQLSGFLDIIYSFKRRRVNSLLRNKFPERIF